MKPREPRIPVLVPARLNRDGAWTDVRIRNVSARGLSLESPTALKRGTFVELRAGRQRVIGYVVWCEGRRSGLRAQERIDVTAFLAGAADRRAAATQTPVPPADAPTARAPRLAERAERSREAARRFQFASMVAAFGGAAVSAGAAASTALGRVSTAIGAALGGG